MTDITRYLDELKREMATGIALEHAYRPALKGLLESVEAGLVRLSVRIEHWTI